MDITPGFVVTPTISVPYKRRTQPRTLISVTASEPQPANARARLKSAPRASEKDAATLAGGKKRLMGKPKMGIPPSVPSVEEIAKNVLKNKDGSTPKRRRAALGDDIAEPLKTSHVSQVRDVRHPPKGWKQFFNEERLLLQRKNALPVEHTVIDDDHEVSQTSPKAPRRVFSPNTNEQSLLDEPTEEKLKSYREWKQWKLNAQPFPASWECAYADACANMIKALEEEKRDRIVMEVVHPSLLMESAKNTASTLNKEGLRLLLCVLDHLLPKYQRIGLYVSFESDLHYLRTNMPEELYGQKGRISLVCFESEVRNNTSIMQSRDKYDIIVVAFPSNYKAGMYGDLLERLQMVHYENWNSRKPVVLLNPRLLSTSESLMRRAQDSDTSFAASLELVIQNRSTWTDPLPAVQDTILRGIHTNVPWFLRDYTVCYFFNPLCVTTRRLQGALLKTMQSRWQVFCLETHFVPNNVDLKSNADGSLESQRPGAVPIHNIAISMKSSNNRSTTNFTDPAHMQDSIMFVAESDVQPFREEILGDILSFRRNINA
eukprot:CAMPEP_0184697164 /NCGR_PEP_ID=MMETSP0313-20130426/4216_1 /TAXON_ID=2792 /ORGANISM="Porphyridium aerugineum, Strain SAG 1380-2" /LENGTH=544 /DNA_ID=CAMNT_0027155927 /DNA_START=432 /DNA_END=2066 /DNA_ORIENTATION=-